MNLLLQHWSFSPFLIVVVVVAAWHVGGLRRLLRRTRPDRRSELHRHAVKFYFGLLSLLVAVESPIEYWARDYFFMHMVQHLMLLFVAPSLIVAGAPWLALLSGFPLRVRRRYLGTILHGTWMRPLRALGRAALTPVVAVVLFNVVMLLWQMPGPFDLAERHNAVQIWLMHPTMFGAAVLFWLQILDSPPVRTSITLPGRASALVGTSIVMWLLAMSMSFFSQHSWYSVYDHVPGVTFSAFADQQLAAGILWVCGDLWAVPALIAVVRQLISQEGGVDAAIDGILGGRTTGRLRWPDHSHSRG